MDTSSYTALGGVRILDFSHVFQGPVGTQLLADYGADVIKVERPGAGDWSRSWGPFVEDISLPFANLNRNKRSLTVDMKSPEGKVLIRKLVAEADVLVHNFRKGVMEKLGFGYDQMAELNPGLIYAWSSGWGDAGPSADRGRGGHDMMARAEGGWFLPREDGKAPIAAGISVDYPAGLNLMIGILIALFHRQQTGRGQFVSTDLLSVAFHAHAWDGASQLNMEKIDRSAAVGGTEAAIEKAFATADGFIEVSPVFSDNALRDISLAMGLGDLSLDPRFADTESQILNRNALNHILGDSFKTKRTEEWIPILEKEGVFCAKVQTFREAMYDEQIKANNMIIDMEHPRAGLLRMLGNPIRLHNTPASFRQPPPDPGEHSRSIAAELGYNPEQIEEMVRQKIIGSN